jgi:BlaI family penicillinase repressor
MTQPKIPKPTDSELGILRILWDRGPSTVREVHEVLEKSKEAGYTTTLKLMQIMVEKGILSRNTSSRTHIYAAALSQHHTQKQLVDRMISTVFNGSPYMLVMQALGNRKPSASEIAGIKSYLNQLEKDGKKPLPKQKEQ